jgi:hypothetical protein
MDWKEKKHFKIIHHPTGTSFEKGSRVKSESWIVCLPFGKEGGWKPDGLKEKKENFKNNPSPYGSFLWERKPSKESESWIVYLPFVKEGGWKPDGLEEKREFLK